MLGVLLVWYLRAEIPNAVVVHMRRDVEKNEARMCIVASREDGHGINLCDS